MTATEAVVFDLDGVLADTEVIGYEAVRRLLAPQPFAWEEYVKIIGTTVEFTIDWLRESHGRTESPEELRRMTSEALNVALDEAPLEPMDGAPELVAAIAQRGIPLAVASQSSPRWVDRTLTRIGLREHFQAIVTASDVARGKPAPDIYLAAAERLGADPARTIAVEDSIPGVAAGLAAGMFVVQLREASYAPPPQPGVHAVVDSLRDFDLGWLEALSRA